MNILTPDVHTLDTAYLCANGLTDYAVLDLETTGTAPSRDEIIEIANLKFVDGEYHSKYEPLVNPLVAINNSYIHGIYTDDVVSAPKLQDIIRDVEQFVGRLLVVGHNPSFDLNFIQRAYYNFLGLERKFLYIDTCALAKDAFPSFSCHKLQSLADELSIAEPTRHRALSDTLVTNRSEERRVGKEC